MILLQVPPVVFAPERFCPEPNGEVKLLASSTVTEYTLSKLPVPDRITTSPVDKPCPTDPTVSNPPEREQLATAVDVLVKNQAKFEPSGVPARSFTAVAEAGTGILATVIFWFKVGKIRPPPTDIVAGPSSLTEVSKITT